MKKVKKNIKLGLDRIERPKQEVEQESIVSGIYSGSSKEYAIIPFTFQVPESISDLQELLESEEEITEITLPYFERKERDRKTQSALSVLRKEVPKDVQEYLDSLKTAIEAGFSNIPAEVLENIPFEHLSSRESVNEYIKSLA